MTLELIAAQQLRDLLSDPRDAEDILSAIPGALEDPLPDAGSLEKLLVGAERARVISALISLAENFCRMALDISTFLERIEVLLIGQISLPNENILLDLPGLQSEWLPAQSSADNSALAERARTIANAVVGLTRRLDADDLVYSSNDKTRRNAAAFERSLVMSATPQKETLQEHFSEGDYRAIRATTQEVSETVRDLRDSAVAHELLAAFFEVQEQCSSVLLRMESASILRGVEATLTVATLPDEINLYGLQARRLAEDFEALERAARSFGKFLRSEFWRFRWRVYEIWILTRVLEWIQENGGKIELLNVNGGNWELAYGRSSKPIATARFPDSHLYIYYQLFEETGDSANMPDIAVRSSAGEMLIVVDPKHGKSYRRSKVQAVLRRYSQAFGAALSAVINYHSVPTYKFEWYDLRNHRELLGSNVAPGTVETYRLGLSVKEVLSRHHLFSSGAGRIKKPSQPWTPRSDVLLYWASTSREVDEPCGAWSYTRETGPRPVEHLLDISDLPVEGIESSSCGRWCALNAGKQLLLASNDLRNRIGLLQFDDSVEVIKWEPRGTRLLVKAGERMMLVSSAAEIVSEWRAPTLHWAPLIAWIGFTGTILYAHQVGLSSIVAFRSRLDGRTEEIANFSPRRSSFLDLRMIPMGSPRSVLFQATDMDWFLVTRERVRQLVGKSGSPIGVSESGRLRIFRGPTSLRASDGVSLLRINRRDQAGDLPLVRFFGEPGSDIKWSRDDASCAFLAARQFRAGFDERRLVLVRIGERDATSISLPGQAPAAFAWLRLG